jgi:hypothetical protein
MKKSIVALLCTLCFAICQAQEELILLDAFEVSSAKADSKPPIVVKKRADFLLLEVTLVNDTREPERRRDEVYTTLRSYVSSIPKGSKIELFTEGFTLTTAHFQIPLVDIAEKRDTSRVTLYAKVPLSESDDVGALSDILRQFVRSIRGDGRTEIFTGNLGLSIRNPEKYRYEVVQAVAEDVKKLREAFGDTFEIVVSGLDARLKWERSSVSEIELFLPYRYEVFPSKVSKAIGLEK